MDSSPETQKFNSSNRSKSTPQCLRLIVADLLTWGLLRGSPFTEFDIYTFCIGLIWINWKWLVELGLLNSWRISEELLLDVKRPARPEPTRSAALWLQSALLWCWYKSRSSYFRGCRSLITPYKCLFMITCLVYCHSLLQSCFCILGAGMNTNAEREMCCINSFVTMSTILMPFLQTW